MTIIESILSKIEDKKPNAFYLNSSGDNADLLLQGSQYSGVACAIYIRKGNEVYYKECTQNFSNINKNNPDFVIIAAKTKNEVGADFAIYNEYGEIIYSSDMNTQDEVSGFIFIGFIDKRGSHYSILLSIHVSSDKLNTSELIIDGEKSFCDALSMLISFSFEGVSESYDN